MSEALLVIDDLFLILLENITDQANRAHADFLKEELLRITLMYERGQLNMEEFERRREGILRGLESLSLQLQQRPKQVLDLGM